MNLHKQPVGRPRNDKTRKMILKTALKLVEQVGYATVTMTQIAETANVGRPTLYRWWQSKGEIVLEAVATEAEQYASLGEAHGSVAQFLLNTFQLSHGPAGPAVVGLMVDAQSDKKLHRQLQALLIGQRRGQLTELLGQRAKTEGKGFIVPVATVVDMLFGAMWYRLLNGHGALDVTFANQLAQSAEVLMTPLG